MRDFGVHVWWAKGTPEIWRQVEETAAKDLPALTSEQKDTAKRRGISREQYQRGVLYQKLAEERLKKMGRILGEAAAPVFGVLGEQYELDAVLIDDAEQRWAFRIVTPEGVREIVVPTDLRESVLAGGEREREALRQELLSRLGRTDLLVRR